MRITFAERLSSNKTQEGASFTLPAKFWDDSTEVWTSSTPTTVRYRIDDASGYVIRDWTTVTPASSITITVSYSDNAILDDCNQLERKTITVQANAGLSTQYQDTFSWSVKNLGGQT